MSVQADAPGKPISPDLFGIFFEDLNYAADGGLYAELIQNRSFEYQATEQPTWNSLSFWELTKRGGGEGKWAVEAARPLHPNNPHYVVLEVGKVADGVGLANPGFDGIALKAGETYDLSLFARQLFMNRRWPPGNSIEGNYLASALAGAPRPDEFAVSSVRDGRTGDIVIKLVNGGAAPRPLRVELSGAKRISRQAIKTVLAGDPAAVNSFDDPARVAPVTSGIEVDRQFDYEAPAHSLTVIRIKTR